MKRKLLILLVLLLAVSTVIAQKSFCEHAHSDCYSKKQFEYSSCKTLGGNHWDCYQRADRLYEGCMQAWNCPAMN